MSTTEPTAAAAPAVPSPTVWPALRYDDAPGGLRFLVDVLGFREALVVPDDSGDITHAELRWPEGGGVMLGSTKYCEGPHGERRPGTTSVYLVSDQVDTIYQRVQAAGAGIARELEDTDYGSHTFTLRDPEGNLWTVGTYRGAR
jgi:uncharacterized glyoxalase superfamily protein PhnB